MRMRIILCSFFFIFGLTAFGELAPKQPVVLIVSGGYGTCASNRAQEMGEFLQDFAAQAEATGHEVKFIYTCYTKLRPSENLEAFSITGHGPPSPVHVFKGGKNYYQNIRAFLHEYLPNEIPPNAFVGHFGQSHGGWLGLEIGASRKLDFMGTFDGVNRTDCNFKNILSARGPRLLKSGACSFTGRKELVEAAMRNLQANGGRGVNTFENASFLHGSPFNSDVVKDVYMGDHDPFYSNKGKRSALSAKAHQAVAVDPFAWKLVLAELNRKMATTDLDWRSPREVAFNDDRRRSNPFGQQTHVE